MASVFNLPMNKIVEEKCYLYFGIQLTTEEVQLSSRVRELTFSRKILLLALKKLFVDSVQNVKKDTLEIQHHIVMCNFN